MFPMLLGTSAKFLLVSQWQNKECIVGLKVGDHKAFFMVSIRSDSFHSIKFHLL